METLASARRRSASSRRSTFRSRCGRGTPRWRWSAAIPSSGSRRRRRRSPRCAVSGAASSAPPDDSADAPDGLSRSAASAAAMPAAALVDHPGVPLVSATGSTAMGRTVGPRLAAALCPRHSRTRRQQRRDRHARPPTSSWRCEALRSPRWAPPAKRCTTLRRLFVHRSSLQQRFDRTPASRSMRMPSRRQSARRRRRAGRPADRCRPRSRRCNGALDEARTLRRRGASAANGIDAGACRTPIT